MAEHGGSVRFDLLLEAQAERHLDRDRHFAHLKRIARQVKAVDDAGARAQAGESLQLLAPSARLRAQGISLIQTSVFLDRELAVLYIRTTFRFRMGL